MELESGPYNRYGYLCYCYTKMIKDNTDLCMVCMSDETEDGKQWDRFILKCGHVFHTRCFMHWCSKKQNINCTLCGNIEDIKENLYCKDCKEWGHGGAMFAMFGGKRDDCPRVILSDYKVLLKQFRDAEVSINEFDTYNAIGTTCYCNTCGATYKTTRYQHRKTKRHILSLPPVIKEYNKAYEKYKNEYHYGVNKNYVQHRDMLKEKFNIDIFEDFKYTECEKYNALNPIIFNKI